MADTLDLCGRFNRSPGGRHVNATPGGQTASAHGTGQLAVVSCKMIEAVALLSEASSWQVLLNVHCSNFVCRWRAVEFSVRRFKDLKEVYILGEVDDVMQVRASVFHVTRLLAHTHPRRGGRRDAGARLCCSCVTC